MKSFMDSSSIERTVERLANEINHSYPESEHLAVIAVGNDSLLFASDIIKKIEVPMYMDTISVSMYKGKKNAPLPIFHKVPQVNLSGVNVVMVFGTIRSGEMAFAVKKKIEEMYDPKSIQMCSLLKEKKSKIYVNFLGKTIPVRSLPVGYGMPLNSLKANSNNIYLEKYD